MQEYANHVALYGIIYILFEKHLREKQVSVYIMKPVEKQAKVLKKVYEEVSLF